MPICDHGSLILVNYFVTALFKSRPAGLERVSILHLGTRVHMPNGHHGHMHFQVQFLLFADRLAHDARLRPQADYRRFWQPSRKN